MNDINFERLSLNDGLSQSIIYCICQDSTGFMWFATQDGLNRFDGHNFKVFRNNRNDNHSLPINYISVLYEDNDEILWIGGMNDNLSMYDKIQDNFKNIKLDDDQDISKSSVITSIVEDNDGILFIGTCDGGLKKYDKKNNCIEHFAKGSYNSTIFSNPDITCLLNDKEGNLWIGTMEEGLFCYNKKRNSVQKFSELFDKENLTDNYITCIYEDDKGIIWVGTLNGLNSINKSQKSLKKYFYNYENKNKHLNYRISFIIQDKKKNLWVSTKNYGLIKFIDSDNYIEYSYDENNVNSISSNSIYTLYIDRSNTLWIGTMNVGVNKMDCDKKLFYNITKNKSQANTYNVENVRAVFKDKNERLWIGTSKNGVFVLEKEKENVKIYNKPVNHLSQLINKNISGIMEDSKKNIWFTSFSEGSLIKYSIENDKLEYFTFDPSDSVFSKIFYGNSFILGTSSKGMINFNHEKEVFEELKDGLNTLNTFSKDKIFCMLKDENILWIGTQNEGLYKYNLHENELHNFRHGLNESKTISDNFVTCLHIDKNRNLWIGTYSGGLNKLENEDQSFLNFNISHGIKDNIKGILEDDANMLWLSTYYGLQRFNPQNYSVKEYHHSDGLQSNEFNDGAYFKDKEGILYFGGINGLTYFHPKEIKDNPYIPNVVITDFEIFNQKVNGSFDNPFLKKNIIYADEINLTYKESVFSFKFAALIYNNPQKNQYAYKMEGFDNDWTYCDTRRRTTYTNLNPGTYIFRVKGSNNDGIWNEEGTSIKINISPPYWKTWWFRGLGALGLITATGLGYRQRLETLKKESKAQEDFSRKLIEVQENEMKRIAHSLHDGIAHDVLILKNKALMALKHKEHTEGLEKALEEISEQSSATIKDVRNIAYDLHPHQLDKLGFTKTIRSIINDVSKSTNIKFDFETDNVDEVLSKESEINLYRVVQESITNIIKHSMASEATLKVSRLEDSLLISITDNGHGFDVNNKEFLEAKHGFGISGIMERIKFMKGEIKFESEINKGTTLRFKIPI
ncbi:MAG: SMP-30/gluconolactonase/LRE family protein [Bacteroidota bacterium]|nr:SMP-30/gluconolactonase/LRE family protein [Bacteroidota bacterium]